MELRPEQLDQHLSRDNLAPVYLLAGDEPLLIFEAADAIRRTAREAGFSERQVLHAETGFDWNELGAAGNALSLFAEQRIIELHLAGSGPGQQGGPALTAYAQAPPDDTVLIIMGGRLDAAQRKSKWYKACANTGAAVYAWPVDAGKLPNWLTQRARSRGVNLDEQALAVLTERTEGNLLAAAQEIDRLQLLFGDARIDAQSLLETSADSARFDIFDLPAKALAGDGKGIVRSLERLREEGVDAVPILWALAREMRLLYTASMASRDGRLDAWLGSQRLPPQKKRLLAQAAPRAKPGRLLRLLAGAAHCDQANKGAATGRPWEELVTLAFGIAGLQPPTTTYLRLVGNR